MKQVITLFILLAVQTAFSQNAEQLLTRDILVSQKVLKTDIKLYNYFYLQQVWQELETPSGREAFVARYMSQSAGRFWDSSFQDTNPKNYADGPGLYFAIDPHISKTYGNSFIEITVPAGTHFINVVAPIPLKKDTFAALMAEGFFTQADVPLLFPKQKGFYRDTLRMMVAPQYANFRQMVQHIFETNGIQFVEYNFNTSLSGFCLKNSYSAFDYVGTHNPGDPKNAIVTSEFAHTTVYSSELSIPNKSTTEASEEEKILKFRSVLQEIVDMRAAGKAVKRDFILSRYSADEYQEIKTETYSCQ